MPIKCGGAPHKVCFLTHDALKENNNTFEMNMTKGILFGQPHYALRLAQLYN